MARGAPGVEDRQPGLPCRIEAPRSDPVQPSGRRLLAVLAIHVEKLLDGRFRSGCGRRLRPDSAQAARESVDHAADSLLAEARDRSQATIVGGGLEILERLDPEVLVDPARQPLADAGHGSEETLGVHFAPQPLEHGHPAQSQRVSNRARERRPDSRQALETLRPLLREDVGCGAAEPAQRFGGPKVRADAIGIRALFEEELAGFIQPARDVEVDVGLRPRRGAARSARPECRLHSEAPIEENERAAGVAPVSVAQLAALAGGVSLAFGGEAVLVVTALVIGVLATVAYARPRCAATTASSFECTRSFCRMLCT